MRSESKVKGCRIFVADHRMSEADFLLPCSMAGSKLEIKREQDSGYHDESYGLDPAMLQRVENILSDTESHGSADIARDFPETVVKQEEFELGESSRVKVEPREEPELKFVPLESPPKFFLSNEFKEELGEPSGLKNLSECSGSVVHPNVNHPNNFRTDDSKWVQKSELLELSDLEKHKIQGYLSDGDWKLYKTFRKKARKVSPCTGPYSAEEICFAVFGDCTAERVEFKRNPNGSRAVRGI